MVIVKASQKGQGASTAGAVLFIIAEGDGAGTLINGSGTYAVTAPEA